MKHPELFNIHFIMTRFYTTGRNKQAFPKRMLAIQIYTGRKSYHSKPSSQEVAALNIMTIDVDKTSPSILKPVRTRGRVRKSDFGCVNEIKLVKLFQRYNTIEKLNKSPEELVYQK